MKIARQDFPDFKKQQFALREVFVNLPTWAGNAALNFYRDSFRRGGFIDRTFQPWPRRKPSILSGKDDKGRAILVQTGRLRKSLRLAVGKSHFTIYTANPYARAHNEGDTITQTVTPKQRRFFFAKSAQAKTAGNQALANTFKAMALSQTLTIQLPKRQFMDIPGQPISSLLERRILLHLERALENALA